jgi:hypothetical protein
MNATRRVPLAALTGLVVLLSLAPATARGQAGDPAASDPLFLGYGTEPGMEFGGLTVASAHSLIARAISSAGGIGERHPGLTPAWEIPLAAAFILVQHEVDGHGGRGREFGLSPSYRFSFDFSGATSLDKAPRTNEEGSLLAAGGAEADGVMAHRMLLDAMRPEGIDAAKVPLAMMAKLDLTLYILQTNKPTGSNRDDFVDQYREGNDMAFYLISRQATRRGVDPFLVWEGNYNPDFGDRLLKDNYDEMRAALVWNLLDPALIGTVYSYFRDHVLRGEGRVHTWMWRPSEGLGLSAAPGPSWRRRSRASSTSTPLVAGSAHRLRPRPDSSVDRTYGYGLSPRPPLGRNVARVSADSEGPDLGQSLRRDGWNANAEASPLRPGGRNQGGSKSEGFYPGLPIAKGSYVSFGVTYRVDFFAPQLAPRPE